MYDILYSNDDHLSNNRFYGAFSGDNEGTLSSLSNASFYFFFNSNKLEEITYFSTFFVLPTIFCAVLCVLSFFKNKLEKEIAHTKTETKTVTFYVKRPKKVFFNCV